MKYISTRGNAPAKTFTEILLGGLAPDGGLYLPEQYPQVTRAELDAWRKLSYADLAFAVLSKFITDIPAADLKAIIDKTYTTAVYSNGRADSDFTQITPLRTLETRRAYPRTVQRPDAGVQGHGDAAARQPVRVCAGETA